jgi:uncharacterized protein
VGRGKGRWFGQGEFDTVVAMNTTRMLVVLVVLGSVAGLRAESIEALREKADAGRVEAQLRLGAAYHAGQGVARDYAEAVRWFRRAAEQGYAEAQCELGFMCEKGRGVETDYAAALQWYRRAAEQKLPRGYNNVGSIYLSGLGVPRDYSEAAVWLRSAAEAGYVPAQNTLGILLAEGRGLPVDLVEAYRWFYISARQGHARARDNVEKMALRLTAAQKEEAHRAADAFLKTRNSGRTETGTGFFITSDGYVLTCYHVVKDALRITVRAGAEPLDAELVKADDVNDLALLKVPGTHKPLPLVVSRGVQLGESVFTIGFPSVKVLGRSAKLTDGTVNSLTGELDTPRFFQVNAAVQPGSSGGPLVDLRGNVVGVLARSFGAAPVKGGGVMQNVNYAIKSSYALAFLESVPEVLSRLAAARGVSERPLKDLAPAAQVATVFIRTER